MTFDAYESSADQGEPIMLFDFSTGLAHWRYTSADRPITYGSNIYAPAAIDASNLVQGQEIKQKTCKIKVPLDIVVVQRLQAYPPSTDLLLTIYSLHYDDPDQQAVVSFIGRVMSQAQKGTSVELACEPAYTGIQTAGLRRRWQVNCPHVLYGVACTLTPTSQKVSTTISTVSGFVVSSPGFTLPSGKSFAGGYLEWDSGNGYFERRTINSASGTNLTLAYGSPDLAPGLAVNAYPGCDHTTTACTAFGNILNYGGAPYVPLKNPLTGNPVY